MSKPERARAILLGTTGVVSAVLAVWLFCWVLFMRPGGVAAGWAAPRGVAAPVIAFQAEDTRAFGRPLERGVAAGSPVGDVRRAVGDLVKAGGREPLVVFLSAPGIGVDGRPYLLGGDEGGFVTGQVGEDALGSIDEILDTLELDRRRPKLLILDAGQVTTDRDLGIYGNSFLHRLDDRLRADPVPNLAVLSACAPGQESHISEPDRRSVFAHYVARGLAGEAEGWDASRRGVTVHGLARYVREHVSRWAKDQRRSVQTPVLLGERSVNFGLRVIGESEPGALTEGQREALAALQGRLIEGWKGRDRLAERAPYRHAPLLWRRYLDGLLRAERLFRASRIAECESALAHTAELAARLDERAGGLPLERAWSLALGRANREALAPEARAELDEAARSIERAVDRLTGREQIKAAIAEAAGLPAEAGAGMIGTGVEAEDGGAPADPAAVPDGAGAPDAPQVSGRSPADPALTERVDGREIPRFVEGQLAVWAQVYLDHDLGPPFDGHRALAFRNAQDVRELAERLAAVDGRVATRLGPVLERADSLRRPAQDRLFAPEGSATDEAEAALHEAGRLYGAALDYAGTLTEATDLVLRLLAELPDLGEWQSRRSTSGLDPQFLGLLADAETLAIRLGEQPELEPESGDTETLRERIEAADRALREILLKVDSGFSTLLGSFRNQFRLAATSQATVRLEEVDDLLRVPLIPADVRAILLEKARSEGVAGLLSARPEAPVDREASLEDEEPRPDPRFWPHALGLARVECALLTLAGADPGELASLRQDLEEGQGATRHPDKAFSALDDFSRRLRRIRRSMADRAIEAGSRPLLSLDDASIAGLLSSADLAARALPRAHLITLADSSSPVLLLARYRRHATLRRIGRRLVADYAPEHGRIVLQAAGELLQSEGLRADLARADAVARSRLQLAVSPSGSIRVGRDDGRLEANVETSGDLPAGMGLVSLRRDPGLPIAVETAAHLDLADDASGVALASIGRSDAPEGLSFVLRQTGYPTGGNRFDLSPTLFYRGRVVDAVDPLQVVLSSDDKIQVRLANPDHRGFGDQFLDHPDRGYLHYGTTLSFRIVLTNTTEESQTAWVRAWLDGAEDRAVVETIELGPGQADDSLQWSVTATDRPPAWNEVPLDKPRFLTVQVKQGGPNGDALALDRRFEFHQLDVKQYAEVLPSFNPATGRLQVVVHHKPTDPVRGPFRVSGTVGTEYLNRDRNGRDVWVARGGTPAVLQSEVFLPPFPEKIKYSISIGLKENAFSGEEPTNVAPPQAPQESAPPNSAGAPNL